MQHTGACCTHDNKLFVFGKQQIQVLIILQDLASYEKCNEGWAHFDYPDLEFNDPPIVCQINESEILIVAG